MTYQEHLAWCKERALAYCSGGIEDRKAVGGVHLLIGRLATCSEEKLREAYLSFISDMKKHPETESHPALMLGFELLMHGHLSTQGKMVEFIEGFR